VCGHPRRLAAAVSRGMSQLPCSDSSILEFMSGCCVPVQVLKLVFCGTFTGSTKYKFEDRRGCVSLCSAARSVKAQLQLVTGIAAGGSA